MLHYLGTSGNWIRIGRRTLQLELTRVCGPRVSRSLKELCEEGYFERLEPRYIDHTYAYRPNLTFLSTIEGKQWQHVSSVFFSSGNPWVELLRRPSVGYGYLNQSGIIVLGAVLSASTGVSTGQIQDYLRGLLGEQTVRNAVGTLKRYDIITRDADQLLRPTVNWESNLTELEDQLGARLRSKKLAKTVAAQRRAFFGPPL